MIPLKDIEYRSQRHPYLSGNFAPVQKTFSLTSCTYTGDIPRELHRGQYVRNGGNPVSHKDVGRDAHWLDGDGMLSGVAFRRRSEDGRIIPEFVNQFALTDLYLSKTTTEVSSPIMPSITNLVNLLSSLLQITLSVMRTLFLVFLSHLPGPQEPIKRISVAVVYHDGRAMATCESGPPIRVQLPTLDTVGWYEGVQAEGEQEDIEPRLESPRLGGSGVLGFLREWTTGHPKVDARTGEILLYHNTFLPPFVHYSVIPSNGPKGRNTPRLINQPVTGVSGARMIHDFGASFTHTVIMDLPLSLDPVNLLWNKQVVAYDPAKTSRFGVFPRYSSSNVRWFESPACCIFHTANTWDTTAGDNVTSVNLLACRMTSATLIYSAGNIAPPSVSRNPKQTRDEMASSSTKKPGTLQGATMHHSEKGLAVESPASSPMASGNPDHIAQDSDQCRLYYYEFDLSSPDENKVSHEWALSAIPFEFPSVRPDREMRQARYIYGCTTSSSCFGVALGRAVKIDVIAKIDAQTLIQRGKEMNVTPVTGCVDRRTVGEILDEDDNDDPIRCFRLPGNHFAQEPRFIPRSSTDGDYGYPLFYVFYEYQLDALGDCPPAAVSELWILDAKNMRNVVAKITLAQRVPYGLHGTWFSAKDIDEQRAVKSVRSLEVLRKRKQDWANCRGVASRLWVRWMSHMERLAG